MAHTYVNKSQANSQTATTINHNHIPGSTATVAILSIVVAGTTQRSGGAPTIDGVTATQADATRGGASGYETSVEVWYVCKSFSGSQFAVSIPNSGGLTCHVEVVSAYAGSGNGSAYHSSDGNGQTSGNGFGLAFSQNAQGDFKYARLGCGEQAIGSITPTWANAVEAYQNDHGAYVSWSHYLICGSSNADPSWAWSSDDGAAVGVCFKISPSYNEAVTLAMNAGVSPAGAAVINAAVSLAMNAGQSQGEVAEFLASLNLGINASVALAAVSAMSVALALQANMGQTHEGGASFEKSASLGASFGVSEDVVVDLSGDVSLGAAFGESQEASGDLGGAVSFGSDFTMSPEAAADLIASLSLDVQTEITLGAAMILSAAISLNTVKGWSAEGSIAANTYEEAMSLGMVAAMTNALQLIIQSGVGFGISAGISESAQLDAAGNIGLGMGAGIAPESQLDAQSTVSFDAQFAKALSAAWAGDVSLGLGMIASLISGGEIPAAVTAARRLFQAIARKRAFKADPRGRDFNSVDRGREFKGRKTN